MADNRGNQLRKANHKSGSKPGKTASATKEKEVETKNRASGLAYKLTCNGCGIDFTPKEMHTLQAPHHFCTAQKIAGEKQKTGEKKKVGGKKKAGGKKAAN